MRILYGGPEMEVCNDVSIDKNGNLHLVGGTKSFGLGKEDGLMARFSPTGTFYNQFTVGHAPYDEEVKKIINTKSNFCDIVVIYSEDQGLGTRLDFLTVGFSHDYFFIPGGNNGSFGFIGSDEEPYDICNTKDKGFAQVGYTDGIGAIDKDIFFVKRDSMFAYGSLYVGLGAEIPINKLIVSAFPIPSSYDQMVTITLKTQPKHDISVEVLDISGHIVTEDYLMAGDAHLNIDLSQFPAGVYFVNLASPDGNGHIKLVKL